MSDDDELAKCAAEGQKQPKKSEDDLFEDFMAQISNVEQQKSTKKRASGHVKPEDRLRPIRHKTGEEMVQYLTRHASKYGNLNPFDVLDLDFDCTVEDVNVRYRQIARLIHPDRIKQNSHLASDAFNQVMTSKGILVSEDGRNLCAKVVEQAKEYVTTVMETTRMKLAKQKMPTKLLEDDKEEFFETVRKRVTIIFADMELMKEQGAKREQLNKEREIEKAKIMKEIEEEEKEMNKQYDAARTDRVQNWKQFVKGEGGKTKKAKHYTEVNQNRPLPQRMIDSHKTSN